MFFNIPWPVFGIILFFIVSYLVCSLIIELLAKLFQQTHCLRKLAEKVTTGMPLKVKIPLVLVSSMFALAGISQVLQYYLFSEVMIFIVFIFMTVGLFLVVFLAPLGVVAVPFITFNVNEKNLLKKIYCGFTISCSFILGTILLIDKNVKIYSDESGSSYSYGNASYKMLGGWALLVLGCYGLLIVSAKYAHYLQVNEPMLTGSKDVGTAKFYWVSREVKRKWLIFRKKYLPFLNQPVLIVTLPLVVLLLNYPLSGVTEGTSQSLVPLNLAFVGIVCLTTLLLQKLLLSQKIHTVIQVIGSILLLVLWGCGLFILAMIFSIFAETTETGTDTTLLFLEGMLIGTIILTFIWNGVYIFSEKKRRGK